METKKFITWMTLLLILFLAAYVSKNYLIERQIVKRIKSQPQQNIKKFDYTIVLVGDSMTEYLGNLEELGYFLNRYYPNKHFLLLNYGYSSTNVLSLPDRLDKDSIHDGRVFQAIDKINFDLILIESFGNNPLTDYPLSEGLQKQNQALDQSIALISQNHPKSKIVFVSTIAPNAETYGKGAVNLTDTQRKDWVATRTAYIKNHMLYAKTHQIPLIDIYDKSLFPYNDGNINYLNPADHIHPSTLGYYFIDDQISQFISQNNLLK